MSWSSTPTLTSSNCCTHGPVHGRYCHHHHHFRLLHCHCHQCHRRRDERLGLFLSNQLFITSDPHIMMSFSHRRRYRFSDLLSPIDCSTTIDCSTAID